MFQLKPLSQEAIPAALAKAERYRLLNEPAEAESICLDILEVQPDNQQALVMLLLALADQFDEGRQTKDAEDVIPRLKDQYERAYYDGIVCERRAKALHKRGGLGSGFLAYDWFRKAMTWYERAEQLRPRGNDDALLRWNACARLLLRNPQLEPRPEERAEPVLSE